MMKDHRTARSVWAAAAGAAACLAVFSCLGANAQTASSVDNPPEADRLENLARTLSDGVSCTSSNPRDALDDRGRKSGAAPADLGAAFAIISSSGDICASVRMAASAMSADLVTRQAA
jgi:hypothetical protein